MSASRFRFSLKTMLLAISLGGVGFGLGLLVQRQLQQEVADRVMKDMLGLAGGPVLPAPVLDFWDYPGADMRGSSSGGGRTVNGTVVVPTGYCRVLTTEDGYEEVVRFYAEKCHVPDADKLQPSPRSSRSGGSFNSQATAAEQNAFYHLVADGVDPSKRLPDDTRPVRVQCLVSTCRSYIITIFVSRADDEQHTHILLVYHPNTDIEE